MATASNVRMGWGRFCSLNCRRGKFSGKWRGGPVATGRYRMVNLGDGRVVPEHQVIAERALGKPLPGGAEVHHVNGVRSDNRNTNLVICQDDAYHKLLHWLARIRDLGGRPMLDAYCSTCKTVKPFSDFYKRRRPSGGTLPIPTCKPCVLEQIKK